MSVRIHQPSVPTGGSPTAPARAQSRLLAQLRFSGDAVTTSFALPSGMTPYAVFAAGSLMREGAGDDYSIATDGFVHRVVFAVAPGLGDDVTIWPQEI